MHKCDKNIVMYDGANVFKMIVFYAKLCQTDAKNNSQRSKIMKNGEDFQEINSIFIIYSGRYSKCAIGILAGKYKHILH